MTNLVTIYVACLNAPLWSAPRGTMALKKNKQDNQLQG